MKSEEPEPLVPQAALRQEVALCRTRTGPMFVFSADQVIGRSLVERGHFSEQKIDDVLEFLSARHGFVPGTFIDIGANIGTHLVHALQPGRFAFGIGVEADVDNFLLLQANVAIRGLNSRCSLVNTALSSEAGEAEMELCPLNFGDHRIRVTGMAGVPDLGESSRAVRMVRRETADALLSAAVPDWSQTLTWMDTQGHEGHILTGAVATLGAIAPAVVVEFWPYGLERAGGRPPYFEFLAACSEIYDINREDWPSEGRVSVSELAESYEVMLGDTRLGHYPHTDLLCIRTPHAVSSHAARPHPPDQTMNLLERSLMTISCRDTDPIPKVSNAGAVVQRGADRVQVMHNGIEVVYGGYYGDWMAHVIRGLRGHHEPQEELIFHVLMRYVRHRTSMVELGCFWAYYAQWYLREVPDSNAICIEPDSQHLQVGRRNAALNGHSERVRFINAWVGGQALPAHAAPTETCSVPVSLPMMDAAAVLGEQAGDGIELLHLDIQGTELQFLRSISRDMAAQKLRFIVVSTHHSSISGSTTTHVDCVEVLRALGASILVEHDVLESFSGDGLILASTQACDRDLWFPEISRNRAERSLFKSA